MFWLEGGGHDPAVSFHVQSRRHCAWLVKLRLTSSPLSFAMIAWTYSLLSVSVSCGVPVRTGVATTVDRAGQQQGSSGRDLTHPPYRCLPLALHPTPYTPPRLSSLQAVSGVAGPADWSSPSASAPSSQGGAQPMMPGPSVAATRGTAGDHRNKGGSVLASCMLAILGPSGAGEPWGFLRDGGLHTARPPPSVCVGAGACLAHTRTRHENACQTAAPTTTAASLAFAGKTTLLDVLAGRKCGPSVSGEIRVNGGLATPLALRKLAG
jgi:hypothetical protein